MFALNKKNEYFDCAYRLEAGYGETSQSDIGTEDAVKNDR
jgi:hypothetical protein